MRKSYSAAATLALLAVAAWGSTAAQAGSAWVCDSYGCGWRQAYAPAQVFVYGQPYPVYYGQPATVYVQPAPVYVQPAPVYVQPAPVYVQPAPVYVQRAPAPGITPLPLPWPLGPWW